MGRISGKVYIPKEIGYSNRIFQQGQRCVEIFVPDFMRRMYFYLSMEE